MDLDSNRIQTLVDAPGESLSVEIKRWIDPDQPVFQAKIVRAVLALRNHGGGYLVIGFDNETLDPDKANAPRDVRSQFHIDEIQGLISRFASEPFEITIEFPERDGQIYPVIVVPSGVKIPVASKADLRDGKNALISVDTVFIRSLNSNNTPSTTKAGWKDWPRIVEVCFDNREADIGRFLRRQLGNLTSDAAQEIAAVVSQLGKPEATFEETLRQYFQECKQRFQAAVKERGVVLPDLGMRGVALVLRGKIPPHAATQEFLNLLDVSNPNYTGWPAWLVTRGFADRLAKPRVLGRVWEALVLDPSVGQRTHIDFMRWDPKGKFYQYQVLQDDVDAPLGVKPKTILDSVLPIIRTAEAMAVGIAFARAMGCQPEETVLSFGFTWDKLKGRQLSSWTSPRYDRMARGTSSQDEVLSFVNVPLDTPLSALGSFVQQAVVPLFEVFDGAVLNLATADEFTRRLIERRLRD